MSDFFYYTDVPTCCGSSIPHIATIPTGSFSRTIAGSSFEVKEGVPFGEDPYPPGRVTDLRVDRVVDSTSEVKLSWTAPGGDFDKGKGTHPDLLLTAFLINFLQIPPCE